MPRAKYRLEQLQVEGFRGFTNPQTINFNGKNVFIFGANGRGKSSIIEAIRWCLGQGALGRPDIEFRNTFYEKQECRVVLVLGGPGGQLVVQRELRPGHEKSRQRIRDSSGKVLTAEEALPSLARLGEEGMQVIFAAQHGSGRLGRADISSFRTVLCFYLGLQDVPELIDQLRKLRDVQSGEATALGLEVEKAEQKYRQQIESLKAQLAVLVKNPPWGNGPLPTASETQDKIGQLQSQFERFFEKTMPSGLKSEATLGQLQQWVNESATRDTLELQKRKDELQGNLKEGDSLLGPLAQAHSDLAAKSDDVKHAEGKLREANSKETLARRVEELERVQSVDEYRTAIAAQAKELCEKHRTSSCPCCGTEFDPDELINVIKLQPHGAPDGSTQLQELKAQLREVEDLEGLIVRLRTQISTSQSVVDTSAAHFARLLGVDAAPQLDAIESWLAQLRADVQSADAEIKNAEEEKDKRSRRIRDLQQELQYHDVRHRLTEVQRRLGAGMEEVRELHKDYRDLLGQIDAVIKVLEEQFSAAIGRALPDLNDLLTDVYRRLTHQASYDSVRIYTDPERAGALELRVASDRLPGKTFPPNVLNGQASKAPHLVPYLVFSRFQPEVMDLDLLLIDDPSESFDTSHVELLVSELSTAAEHAQLVVASHEREKFLPQINTKFDPGSRVFLAVDQFDPVEGPTVVAG
jgi:DNA repair exonuclease SbcCD ATPase subunit